jgi:hypothetical protein
MITGMSDTRAVDGSRQYVRDLRRHVLAPLDVAKARVEEEKGAIEVEIRAFSEFRDAVQEVEPAVTRPKLPVNRSPARDAARDTLAEIRQAYRDTVMVVPHFDEEYGESLEANVTAELGPDCGDILRTDSQGEFTPVSKQTLLGRTTRLIEKRRAVKDNFDQESDSIAAAKRAVTELLDDVDDGVIPTWYREDFEDALEDIASDRQTALQGRLRQSRLGGHDLCEYVYGEETWTYPVLTAVTRLRNSVSYSR